jgi:hypothetical protein
MGFIDKFFRKKPEDVTKEDLEAFLTRKIEENLNLDYKTIQAYYDFDELSKDVSAFANSEGGLLILGFSQDEIKKGKAVVKVLPKELTWGEEALSKERLEDNLVGKIQPRIDGIKIQPVREGNGSMRVIFLVDIPQSKNRPHMASDKRYYKRLNFRKTPMEHFEIVNLLKVRWVLNERIIEKIYEPLASILEKNSKEFSNYQSPNTREIEEILSRTYYTWQMPQKLIEELDLHIVRMKDLDKKQHFARREMKSICYMNVAEHLNLDPHLFTSETPVRFQLSFEKSKSDLHPVLMYELLMKNKTITDYTNSLFYLGKCEKVSVNYDNEWYHIELDDFDDLIWKNCLKEARENQIIGEFKESADGLWEEALDLIDNIIMLS